MRKSASIPIYSHGLRNPGMLYHALYTWSMWVAIRSDKELGEKALEKSLFSSYFMYGFAAITESGMLLLEWPLFPAKGCRKLRIEEPTAYTIKS